MRSFTAHAQTFRAACALPTVWALVLGGLVLSASAQAQRRGMMWFRVRLASAGVGRLACRSANP